MLNTKGFSEIFTLLALALYAVLCLKLQKETLYTKKREAQFSALNNERDPSTPLRTTKRRALELLFLHKNETQRSENLGNFLNCTSLGLVP